MGIRCGHVELPPGRITGVTTERLSRRRLLRAGGVAACGLAGCATRNGEGGDETVAVSVDGDCAGRLRVAVVAARVEPGSTPRVELRVENGGDAPVGYDVVVVFRQPTSLGQPVRAGRARVTGTLAPGERVGTTATSEGREATNADRYEVSATASCPT